MTLPSAESDLLIDCASFNRSAPSPPTAAPDPVRFARSEPARSTSVNLPRRTRTSCVPPGVVVFVAAAARFLRPPCPCCPPLPPLLCGCITSMCTVCSRWDRLEDIFIAVCAVCLIDAAWRRTLRSSAALVTVRRVAPSTSTEPSFCIRTTSFVRRAFVPCAGEAAAPRPVCTESGRRRPPPGVGAAL